jgi:hypothetical protein
LNGSDALKHLPGPPQKEIGIDTNFFAACTKLAVDGKWGAAIVDDQIFSIRQEKGLQPI